MQYNQTIRLKDGRTCVLRNGTEKDAEGALNVFKETHAQTDFLLTYPEENTGTVEWEAEYLRKKTESDSEIELVAEVDGTIVGLAGIERIGSREKIRHRADFGISIDQAYCGLGIGRALTKACIECARAAGYAQIELEVVAENERAVALYRSMGFTEFGRNPRGFRSRFSGWQTLLSMRLELDE